MRSKIILIGVLLMGLFFAGCKTGRGALTAESKVTGFENGRIISNYISGYMDTVLVHLSGHIFDNDGDVVPTAEIEISTENFNKMIRTNFNGEYQIYLEPETYNITFQFAGMDTIKVQKLNMLSGESRKIDVSLGKSGTLTHYLIEDKK